MIDMGGTSTDIAFLDDGFPRLSKEGAKVGKWRTKVRAIDIWTCGLGGDSLIHLDLNGEVVFGPERVVPWRSLPWSTPGLREKMVDTRDIIYYLPCKKGTPALSKDERKVLDYIGSHVPCRFNDVLTGMDDVVFVEDQIRSLLSRGFILQTGLTPTDVLHANGTYQVGDVEAANVGLGVLAEKHSETPEKFAATIMELIPMRVAEELIKKSLIDSGGDLPGSKGFDLLLKACASGPSFGDISLRARPTKPIVALGAPAGVFITPLGSKMDCNVILPADHDVRECGRGRL